MTDWFDSNVFKKSFEKLELLVALPPDFVNVLQKIEDLAINGGLILPKEFETQLTNTEIFKRLPPLPKLYITLNHAAIFLSKLCP